MSYYNLGQYDSALKDGEECLKIDPLWAKGYKCKELVLEGMRRPRDAEETLLDGRKMCNGHDQNFKAVLDDIIKRLNKETGFLGVDLDLLDKKMKENYCAVCNVFKKDMAMGNDKTFISCDRCKMTNYCSQEHMLDDRVAHNEVCEELLMIRRISNIENIRIDIQMLPKEDALILLGFVLKGPLEKIIMSSVRLSPDFKNIMDYLKALEMEPYTFVPIDRVQTYN